jgi:hypothetical protein
MLSQWREELVGTWRPSGSVDHRGKKQRGLQGEFYEILLPLLFV